MSPRRGGGNWGRGWRVGGTGVHRAANHLCTRGWGVCGWRGWRAGVVFGFRGNTRTLIVRRVGNTLAAHAFNSKNSVYGIVHKMCKKAPPRHPPLPPSPPFQVFSARGPQFPPHLTTLLAGPDKDELRMKIEKCSKNNKKK